MCKCLTLVRCVNTSFNVEKNVFVEFDSLAGSSAQNENSLASKCTTFAVLGVYLYALEQPHGVQGLVQEAAAGRKWPR